MYDHKIDAADKAVMYRDLASALRGLVSGEPDPIANMANAAALIWETLPGLNWAGFYRNLGGELVVGPFLGRPACIRITSQCARRWPSSPATRSTLPCRASTPRPMAIA